MNQNDLTNRKKVITSVERIKFGVGLKILPFFLILKENQLEIYSTKTLQIVGIGYRAELKGEDVVLYVGHVKPTIVKPLEGVKISVAESKSKDVTCTITVTGNDKFRVGQSAALIHDAKRPEPYLGKGIRYVGEYILRKEGKRAGSK